MLQEILHLFYNKTCDLDKSVFTPPDSRSQKKAISNVGICDPVVDESGFVSDVTGDTRVIKIESKILHFHKTNHNFIEDIS